MSKASHTSLPVTDRRTRFEWVKMFYPDMPKGIPVGIIRQVSGLPGWVFDHRTPESQWSEKYRSPMGLDVATLVYLVYVLPIITEIHFGVKGKTDPLLVAPLGAFSRTPPVPAQLPDGSMRHRIFLPIEQWVERPYYPAVEPPYWDVTHLTPNGQILARHVADRS